MNRLGGSSSGFALLWEVYQLGAPLYWSEGDTVLHIRSVHLVCAHAVSTIKRFVADLTFSSEVMRGRSVGQVRYCTTVLAMEYARRWLLVGAAA